MRQNKTGARCLMMATVVALGAAPALLAYPSSSSASAVSPTSLLSTALRNADSASWVHEVITAKESGLVAIRVDDIGTKEGRQVVTLSSGATAEVMAFDQEKKAYIRANSLGVSDYFAISTAHPGKYANKWLKVTPVDADYTAVISATTLGSDFAQALLIPGPLSLGAVSTIGGVQVRSVLGSIPASSENPKLSVTLYVSTSGKVLPVELRETGKGLSAVIDWSRWGVSVHLVAPTGFEPAPAA